MATRIRITLPQHLRELARVNGEISVEIGETATVGTLLDAIERDYPGLCGTIRDQATGKRRPFVRFFLCGEDWSFEPADKPLPPAIAQGKDVFMVVGAIAGG